MTISTNLDAALWSHLLTGLGIAACAVGVRLACGWIDLSMRSGRPSRRVAVTAATLGLGTGLWAAQGLVTLADRGHAVRGYDLMVQGLIWLFALVGSLPVFASTGRGVGGPLRRAGQAMVLACGVVAAQIAGAGAGDGTLPATWPVVPLGMAWTAALGGTLLALTVLRALADRDEQTVAWSQWAAGLAFGAVTAYVHDVVAAALPPLTPLEPALLGRVPAETYALVLGLFYAAVVLGQMALLKRARHTVAQGERKRTSAATHQPRDSLTRLPKLPMFQGTLAQATRRADGSGERLALFYVNLDDFGEVNRVHGRKEGDAVLREVATRLRALAEPHMAARLGGDEFLILLNGNPSLDAAAQLAARIGAAIARPIRINGREGAVRASVGIAMYPEHGAASTLIEHAAAAMGSAKSEGGSGHAFFEARMLRTPRDQMGLVQDLKNALDRGQLELVYQPKIHAPTGQVSGAEALMRWHHPERGMVSPSIFIPLAERYGLIRTLGLWTISEACRQLGEWRDGGMRMRVAINLSAHQLRQPDLAQQIQTALARHNVRPELLTCEITETAAMEDTQATMGVLDQLHAIGVHLSIDDFGTGHSSLSYLRKLPADELKIDRSFVLDLETSADAREVATAIINLAKALRLNVVAEGVETEGQNRLLREFGCDQLQGYLFARPMSAKALAMWAIDDVGPRTMAFRDSIFKATEADPALADPRAAVAKAPAPRAADTARERQATTV